MEEIGEMYRNGWLICCEHLWFWKLFTVHHKHASVVFDEQRQTTMSNRTQTCL